MTVTDRSHARVVEWLLKTQPNFIKLAARLTLLSKNYDSVRLSRKKTIGIPARPGPAWPLRKIDDEEYVGNTSHSTGPWPASAPTGANSPHF